jgi:DNA gyrase subunit B
MYLGRTGAPGLQALLAGVLANSLAEARAGCCTHVGVDLLADGGARIRDDGRGIPVRAAGATGLSFLELACTQRGPGRTPLHRVYGFHNELLIANALSSRLVVETSREGRSWRQEFSRGTATTPLMAVGPAETSGTTVTFWPDGEVLGDGLSFDRAQLEATARTWSFLTPGLRIDLTDERTSPPQRSTFHAPGGLADQLEDWIARHSAERVHPTVIHGSTETAAGRAAVAFCWVHGGGETCPTYANAYHPPLGGTHLSGFRTALAQSMHAILRRRHPLTDRETPTGDVVRWGLLGVVAVDLPDPQFSGMLREKLNNVEAADLVGALTRDLVEAFFRQRPDEGELILEHVLDSRPVDPKTGAADSKWRYRPEPDEWAHRGAKARRKRP